ncbi:hypothetical protein H5410_015531 [Solanum commersonii]|uniref:Uncharacterized protein n=1 Tax=Solanum commersonii TaxID=4109 RepID=A0A9J5ZUD6_SOLCO|nr:hypothetical protein H5410_015531 [Solanum commersonii]
MALRFNIEVMAINTSNWTCKVQIMDMKQILSLIIITSHPLIINIFFICISQSSLTLQEQQIRAAAYGDDIEYYVEKFILLDTYLISVARVKVSLSSYERLIHKFYCLLDKEILVEHVKSNDELEKPLSAKYHNFCQYYPNNFRTCCINWYIPPTNHQLAENLYTHVSYSPLWPFKICRPQFEKKWYCIHPAFRRNQFLLTL